MNAAARIVIAIQQAKLDVAREGRDQYMAGYVDGLKTALAIEVGEAEAAQLLSAS